jgi:endonuclease I
MSSVLLANQIQQKLEMFQKTYHLKKISQQIPERYKELKGLKGKELLEKLHTLTGQNYKQHEYKPAKTYMYNVVDNRGGKVFTLYSGIWAKGNPQNAKYKESGDANEDGKSNDSVNCEHTWPQSKFDYQLPMRSDLHHLYPTFKNPNNERYVYPFGYVSNEEATYWTSLGSMASTQFFEPADSVKGNIARTQLYFYTRYYDKAVFKDADDRKAYWDDRIATLLKWNKQDPPDDWEITRNELIEKFQGNRNPFIDFHGFADLIGEEVFKK